MARMNMVDQRVRMNMVDQRVLQAQIESMQTMMTMVLDTGMATEIESMQTMMTMVLDTGMATEIESMQTMMTMVLDTGMATEIESMQTMMTMVLDTGTATEGEKNNGFDVLYHNMKHGHMSSKELADFIRERATIEEAYGRSMTKLAKSASNFSQLGTFAPVWDVFRSSTERLAGCHLELVRRLLELLKEVQKYIDDQAKAHKKTKEEVASTLEAVQNIQSTSQALQKAKENYNSKVLDQERLRKEGATARDVDKAGVKAKKATEAYKSYVEKYASAKTEFEQRMAETAQKFQGIEENHVLHMKEIIQSYARSVEETHAQIGEVQQEFVNNMENTSVESLILKLAETKGTGTERPGPIEFEECNVAVATEGIKPKKRKAFGIPGRRKDNKDTDSTESVEGETNTANGAPPGYYGAIDVQNANVPQVDEDGFCIPPEQNENDILSFHTHILGLPNIIPMGPIVGVPNMGPTLGVPNIIPMGSIVGVPNMGPTLGVPNMGPTVGLPNIIPMGPTLGVPNIGPTLGVPNMGPTLGVPNIIPMGPRGGLPNMVPTGPRSGVSNMIPTVPRAGVPNMLHYTRGPQHAAHGP
ncbi:hypothetical protein ACEWY4_004738 [Coilia grayii]|uniref:F-BAR domain-containing protein n=1 Tax=Coilia grayii TaxID=363190 RepID=A0ABD1KMC7_9TELE